MLRMLNRIDKSINRTLVRLLNKTVPREKTNGFNTLIVEGKQNSQEQKTPSCLQNNMIFALLVLFCCEMLN